MPNMPSLKLLPLEQVANKIEEGSVEINNNLKIIIEKLDALIVELQSLKY